MAKLTANAFLAQRISSINSIGALCEATGADVREVARAIGTDSRIGDVGNFWEGVVELNNWHQKRISQLIVKKLFGTISEKKIIVLGFAFKANTNDTRESSAIQICKDLIQEGAFLHIHDPKVSSKQISADLSSELFKENEYSHYQYELEKNFWFRVNNISSSLKNADAILILTEWDEYSNIDWHLASKLMRKPAWVFDARSIVDKKRIVSTDLNFWRIGDGSLN